MKQQKPGRPQNECMTKCVIPKWLIKSLTSGV